MVSNLALFCLATVWATFWKIGWFFPNHMVTLESTDSSNDCLEQLFLSAIVCWKNTCENAWDSNSGCTLVNLTKKIEAILFVFQYQKSTVTLTVLAFLQETSITNIISDNDIEQKLQTLTNKMFGCAQDLSAN